MKNLVSLFMFFGIVLSFNACTHTKEVKQSNDVRPYNIDKNNVGITSKEEADQTDPTLIEGNLEDNDFKN